MECFLLSSNPAAEGGHTEKRTQGESVGPSATVGRTSKDRPFKVKVIPPSWIFYYLG